MKIRLDDLQGPEIRALLEEHLAQMHAESPPESVHALDIEKLRRPEITFWTAWDESELVGCGALKLLDATHGEIKSMRTPAALRRRGAGRALLAHIIEAARARHAAPEPGDGHAGQLPARPCPLRQLRLPGNRALRRLRAGSV